MTCAANALSNEGPPRRRIVVASDLASPHVSPLVVRNFAGFIADFQPDEILGLAGPGLVDDCDAELRDPKAISMLRALGYDGPILLQTPSSHWSPVAKPSRLAGLGVDEFCGVHNVTAGWMSICAAGTGPWRYPVILAMRLARAHRQSIIMGGTRALGMIVDRVHGEGPERVIAGVEVGTLMTLPMASPRTWQQGFGVLDVNGETVTPMLVPIHRDGTLAIDNPAAVGA